MPLRLFADRRRVAAYLTRAAYMGAMIGFFFFTSQLMQDTLGFSALQAGLGFLPMTVVNFAVASAVPHLGRRWDAGWMLATGVALTLAGIAWLSSAGPDSSYLSTIAAPMLLVGAGQGLAFAPLTSFGIVDAPAADAGAASGLVNTFHQFGTTMGLAVLVAISAGAPDAGARFTLALHGSSILLALGLLLVLALLLPAHRSSRAAR
ncbi:MFS transporter [Terrabacter carboxydivorans]|uniref:MFS transporter n=1 Tax=Terrabacter carboxydivorans TaxID=619730 RepID=A0ABP5ZX89_9MICO